ncbi:MAG: tRNA glutamyl-Q(34) synthetase GluQRS [Hyphomicrobium sp.]
MTAPVFRFAPSPNGRLHLGHALSALTGFDAARRSRGRFLVRIEDIDSTRARPELVSAIFDDLAWLGLRWEEPVLHQSQHLAAYKAAAERLHTRGLVYPCFASRSDIVAADTGARDPEGAVVYPGNWRGRDRADVADAHANGQKAALRLDMAKALEAFRRERPDDELAFTEIDADGTQHRVIAHPQRWGDVVLLRKDVPASYLLAVVVDDARQGITHVTRGRDLYAATDVQRLLQELLGLPEPLYAHHRLILDDDGRKLSKSRGSTSLSDLRAAGATPADIRRMVGLDADVDV